MIYRHIDMLFNKKLIPKEYVLILTSFLKSYEAVLIDQGKKVEDFLPLFKTFIDAVQQQFRSPYQFTPLHRAIRSPFDYYQFGIDMLIPLVDLPHSTASGLDHLKEIKELLSKRHNVILFANHQIEADPQAMSILLRDHAPSLAENIFFVAGTRVTTDPLAIPFSMGRNLICIYSKKYIDTPPKQKHEKQLHNKRSLERMVELLNEGGHIIYVAPSGGRDRADSSGHITVAPFDPQSIELFYLMTKKAHQPTHFFPLALSTYHLLPPPDTTQKALGEMRITRGGAIHLAFGSELDMEHFPGSDKALNKRDKRKKRATYIWNEVKKDYARFPE